MLHREAEEPERVRALGFISKDFVTVHVDLLMFGMLEAKLYHHIVESR
jgi:hypothetical protein